MAVLTGKTGTLHIDGSEATCITRWTLDRSAETSSHTSNCTGGARVYNVGATEAQGTFRQLLDSAGGNLVTEVGDEIGLVLHVDDSSSGYYSLNAIITGEGIVVDLDTAEPLGIEYSFRASSAVTSTGILNATLSS